MPQSRVPFYTNEQYVSADLNTIQRIAENALEVLAGFSSRPLFLGATGGALGFDNPLTAVLGGLNATTDGAAGLIIQPGLLLTTLNSASDNPSAAGAWLALNPAAVTIAIPSPVADTWYLVGGLPVLTDAAAEARNVFDPPNRALISPTPNLVKRRNVGIAFSVSQCTTPDLTSAGFGSTDNVPLYAVFRPGGGGPINAGLHIVDLRPSVPIKRPIGGSNLVENHWRYTTGLKLTVRIELEDIELYASNPSIGHPLVDPMAFVNPLDSAPAANQWWYLYLARYRPLGDMVAPRNAQPALLGMRQQGLLVFSRVAPFAGNGNAGQDTSNARRNASALRAPTPYGTTDIAIGDAVCFGALRRNAANDGWLQMQAEGDHVSVLNSLSNPGQSFALASPTVLTEAPPMARALDLQIACPPSASAYPGILYVKQGGGALTTLYRSLGAVTDPSGGNTRGVDAPNVPIAETGLTLLLDNSEGSSGSFNVLVRGYRF